MEILQPERRETESFFLSRAGKHHKKIKGNCPRQFLFPKYEMIDSATVQQKNAWVPNIYIWMCIVLSVLRSGWQIKILMEESVIRLRT